MFRKTAGCHTPLTPGTEIEGGLFSQVSGAWTIQNTSVKMNPGLFCPTGESAGESVAPQASHPLEVGEQLQAT